MATHRVPMQTKQVAGLVAEIYQAALEPDGWDAVFASLRRSFRSPIAGMFTQDTVTGAYSADRLSLDEKYHRLYAERIAAVNPWIRVPGLMRPGRVLSDESLEALHGDRKAYVETEFHQDFARPQGFRHVMGGTLLAHGHRMVNFTYFRTAADGPYSAAEMRLHALLAGHIAKAVGMSGELDALRRQVAASSYLIDRLAFGVILLDATGRIQFANREARRMLDENDGLGVTGAALYAQLPADSRRLKALIRAVTTATALGDVPPSRTIITRPSGRMGLSVAALPVPPGRTLFESGAGVVLLLVTDPERRPILDGRHLAERFGFSRSETKLAAALAQGLDLRQAATTAGLTYETARWYVKAMFAKTGARRQAELVGLLLADLGTAVLAPAL